MGVIYKEHPEEKMVEIEVDGKVTSEDFDSIAPSVESFIAQHGKIKLLEIIRDFSGFELSVLAKGIKFDVKHMKDFSHCAVVSESGWVGPFTRMAAPFFDIEIKNFSIDQEPAAREWLRSENSN